MLCLRGSFRGTMRVGSRRIHHSSLLALVGMFGLSLALSGCGGTSATTVVPPPSYSIAATALAPSSINAGNSATSTIMLTPVSGFTGNITLSCNSITGGGMPAPACSFTTNPVTIAGASAGSTKLTVTTSSTTPAATYAILVAATALSPSSINTGNFATSTITVTPAKGYTGNVTVACSSITGGGTPSPACSFSTNPVAITGASSGTTTLTVSTNFGTPAATYTVHVSATDGAGLMPSDGVESLQLSTSPSIQHVVIIFQENRTPDNLFQDPNLINAGADIAP